MHTLQSNPNQTLSKVTERNLLTVETQVICFSHLDSTLFGVEYTRDSDETRRWYQEVSHLAVTSGFTAIRIQSSHRRRGQKGQEITRKLLWQFKHQFLPPHSVVVLQLPQDYRNTAGEWRDICLQQDETNLIIGCLQILVCAMPLDVVLHHPSCFQHPLTFLLHPVFTFLPNP